VIQNLPNSVIRGLSVRTFVTHTYSGDITMTLTSPQGTTITLTQNNGGEHRDVFDGVLWKDSGVPVQNFSSWTESEVPTLAPQDPFSIFRGQTPNGVWTLAFRDNHPEDMGNFSYWVLDIEGEAFSCFLSTSAFLNFFNRNWLLLSAML